MTLSLGIVGILFFIGIFAFDYAGAVRINYQFFWKPWAIILVLLIFMGISGLRIAQQRTESASILSGTNNFYQDAMIQTNSFYANAIKDLIVATNSLSRNLDEKRGELAQAIQERDKYQLLLSPFEAMAIAKYTNAPVDQRLDLLITAMTAFTNVLNRMESEKPNFALRINGTTLKEVDNTPGAVVDSTPILIKKSDLVTIEVENTSKTTAQHVTIDFYAPINQTNFTTEGWNPEPGDGQGRNHWTITSQYPLPQHGIFQANPFKVLPGYNQQLLGAHIYVCADNSISHEFAALLLFSE